MKKIIFLIACLLFFSSFSVAQNDPYILSIISSVSEDTLAENLKILSGESAALIDNTSIFIKSRYCVDAGNSSAAAWIKKKLTDYGLQVSLQDFIGYGKGQNVLAVQPGNLYPNQKVIICAHYDDMPAGSQSPGADDNGSGTVAVLEAARLLSKHLTNYTIIYALWDEEESGLKGSNFYANEARLKNDNIIAVINVDMIGYDSNNDFKCEIHSETISSSSQISSKMVEINKQYFIGLKTVSVIPGSNGSDHESFWENQYPAIMLIESSSDFNVNYHRPLDKFANINQEYLLRCSKLAIGTVAAYAQVSGQTYVDNFIPASYTLDQNFPNPFNPSTRIRYSLAKESHVKLLVYDALGREVSKLVDEVQSSNNYEIEFNSSDCYGLSSGVYFYALYAGDFFSIRKMVLMK